MGYVTISEGFRIGASNGIPACTAADLANPGQAVCALPDEVQYHPDTTTNYEVGIRSQWLDRRLTFNGALYYIDWKDPQLASVTALWRAADREERQRRREQGYRVVVRCEGHAPDDRGLQLRAHDGRALGRSAFRATRVRAAGLRAESEPNTIYTDGQPGDRLPGSPQDQGTVRFGYDLPLSAGRNIDFNYGVSAIGNVITTIGERAGGQQLGGYAVHSASAILRGDALDCRPAMRRTCSTSSRSPACARDSRFVQTVTDVNGDPVHVRSYAEELLRPREIGLKFSVLARPVTSAIIRRHDR